MVRPLPLAMLDRVARLAWSTPLVSPAPPDRAARQPPLVWLSPLGRVAWLVPSVRLTLLDGVVLLDCVVRPTSLIGLASLEQVARAIPASLDRAVRVAPDSLVARVAIVVQGCVARRAPLAPLGCIVRPAPLAGPAPRPARLGREIRAVDPSALPGSSFPPEAQLSPRRAQVPGVVRLRQVNRSGRSTPPLWVLRGRHPQRPVASDPQ